MDYIYYIVLGRGKTAVRFTKTHGIRIGAQQREAAFRDVGFI